MPDRLAAPTRLAWADVRDEEEAVEDAAAPRGTSVCSEAAPAALRGIVRSLECQTDLSLPALYDVTFSLGPALPGAGGGGAGELSEDNVLPECVSREELDEKLEKFAAVCKGDLAAGAPETLTAVGVLVHSATQQAIDQVVRSFPLTFNENLSNAARVPLSKVRDELFAVGSDLKHKVAELEKRLLEFAKKDALKALDAYVTHDALNPMLDRFSTLDDLKGVFQQVPPLVQKAIPPAISASIGPLVNRSVDLEAKVLQVEGACLALGDRLTNLDKRLAKAESERSEAPSGLNAEAAEFVMPTKPRAGGDPELPDSDESPIDIELLLGYAPVPVRFGGLNRAALNGQIGMAPDFDGERVAVQLLDGSQPVRIRPINLRKYREGGEKCERCKDFIVLSEFPPCECPGDVLPRVAPIASPTAGEALKSSANPTITPPSEARAVARRSA